MNDPSAGDSILAELAEEFANRYRRGERPSLNEFIDKYPNLAEPIRELFPAMVMMEQFGSVAGPPTGPYAKTVTPDGTVPKKLGEYRILREVSRGGMGIVYEAVQESLGRHVALKVLPFQSLADGNQLERFRREARAAANLHHTNIVPVFGVGEHQGIHYYAMQFIQGQSLANVLEELRRMRRRSTASLPAVNKDEARTEAKEPAPELTVSLAGGLLTGRFPDKKDNDQKGSSYPGEGHPPEPSEINREGGSKPDSAKDPENDAPRSDISSPTLSNISSDRHRHGDLTVQSAMQYFRSVARVGVQVAEALAYAHQQGILHRDIKPSNLLLDTEGTLWVTDFGLAKAADSDDLTRTGDIVGTVRYMAPERFQGKADPRNDIYGLGITLYEMLTLQPAFEDSDRARLIKRVAQEDPPRPRKLDPHIPRDLETIVLKAIAKEPARRYASADALAEDLRRFLADRPIRARRVSSLEKAWRWCRRNPLEAILTGSVAALVLALMIGLSVAALSRKERNEALANLNRAEAAEHLAQARAFRWSGKVGQRFKSLEELTAAATHHPSLELRNEAIACLALTDLRLAKSWEGLPTGTQCLAFDSEFKRYARSDSRGNIGVRRVADDQETMPLPGPGTHAYYLKFSPDGRFLAAIYHQLHPTSLYIWDLERGKEVLCLGLSGGMDFSPDSRRVVVGDHGSVRFYDLVSREEEKRLTIGQGSYDFAFDPTGRKLAVACSHPNGVEIYDLGANKVVMTLPNQYSPRWSFDGRMMATTSNGRIFVWDAPSGKEKAVLQGHDWIVTGIAFNHRGDLLASTSMDGTLRLWDPMTGRQLLRKEGAAFNNPPQFSPDDQLLAYTTTGSKVELWEVATGRDFCQVLRGPYEYSTSWTDFNSDGRLLASASGDGVRLWDLNADREAAFLLVGETRSVFFHPVDGALITSGDRGAFRWPMVAVSGSESGCYQLGPPERLCQPHGTWEACLDLNGHKLAVAQRGLGRGLLLNLEKKADQVQLGNHPNIARIAISPDDRWVATATWWGFDSATKIWDAQTGKLAQDLPRSELQGDATVAFSPDGRWLLTGNNREYRFWEVGSWEPGRFIAKEVESFGAMAFSRDGKIMAILKSPHHVQLIDLATRSELGSFEVPDSQHIQHLCFSLDGSRLAASCNHPVIQVWNLRAIRRELGKLDLDWDLPPYPNAKPNDNGKPLQIKVDLGELCKPAGADLSQPRAQVGLMSFLLALNPFNYQAYMQRGSAYTKLGEWPKAIDDLSLALALMPSDAKTKALALVRRSYSYNQIKDFVRSLADAQLAVKLDPDNLQACNNLAWLYVAGPENMRNPETALPLAQKAVDKATNKWEFLNTLGVVFYRLGRYEETVATLERSLREGNNQAAAFDLYFLAMAHARLGDAANARDCYDRALKWHQQHQGELCPEWAEELASFRAEAEALLAKPTRGPQD